MDDNVGVLLTQVSRLLRRSFDERARAIGVTRPQWQMLTILVRNPGIHQGGLAELLEVEPITAARMIDRLQDAGLVERRADPADRRTWRVHPTQKGKSLLEALQPSARETLDEALEGILPAEQDRLLKLLCQVRANLSRRTAAEEPANG
jgi:DNA-binding MarR family transcriptional regulator